MHITFTYSDGLLDSTVQNRGVSIYLNDICVFVSNSTQTTSYDLKYNIGDTIQVKYKDGYYPGCVNTDFIIHDLEGNEQNIGMGWYEHEGEKMVLDQYYRNAELKQYKKSIVCP